MCLPVRIRRLVLPALLLVLLAWGAPAGAQPPPQELARIMVGLHRGATPNDVAAERVETDARLVRHLASIGVVVLEVPERAAGRALARFEQNPVVEYAEPDGLGELDATKPNDRHWSSQWGLKRVGADKAWDQERGDPGVIVAILDTGIDASHPDLQGAVVSGTNVVHSNDNVADDHGHGTRVAGVVAARTNNRIGVAGTCWYCSIMPVKVARADGSLTWSDVATGITWATDQGADVISMSFSGPRGNKTLARAVQYAFGHGVVLLGSAGNSGNTTIRYPGGYAEVVAVAGTTDADELYSWSTHGSWVDVAAPGCNYTTRIGETYGSFCGTSSAAPLVAGIAGLAKSLQPAASVSDVVLALTSSAVDIGFAVQHGRVDANATLGVLEDLADSNAESPSDPPADPTEPDPVDDELPASDQEAFFSWKGNLNNKHSVRVHGFDVEAGTLSLALVFARAPELTVRLLDANGVVLAWETGPSVLRATAHVSAGAHVVEVGGEPANYTLTARLEGG